MTQRLSIDINIPDDNNIKICQGATYENFIGQFQQYCPKLLCIVNGNSLRYYDKTSPLPGNIKYDHKQRNGTITEYYFRDKRDDTIYCVFGREAASIFYPNINIDDPINIPEKLSRIDFSKNNRTACNSIIKILPNSTINRNDIESDSHQPNIFKPILRDNTISKPIQSNPTKNTIPLFREKQSKDVGENTNTHQKDINSIVIIDKGVKLTFPNPNYPINIKTYYPEM